MEIILLNMVKKLGRVGDVVCVKNGFGRYLVQSGNAVRANERNLDLLQEKQDSLTKRKQELLSSAQRLSVVLKGYKIIFVKSASDDGRLFGSVSKRDISSSLSSVVRRELPDSLTLVEHNHVMLSDSIKETGVHPVLVEVHPDVESFEVFVSVASNQDTC